MDDLNMENLKNQLLSTFQVEYQGYLKSIHIFLSNVENNITPTHAELEEMHRIFHSLKGGFRVVDMKAAQTLSFCMERLFSQVKDGEKVFDAAIAGVVAHTLQTIEVLVDSYIKKENPGEPDALVKSLDDYLCGGQAPLFTVGEEKGEKIKKEEQAAKSQHGESEDIKKRLFEVFREECKEHIEKIRSMLPLLKELKEFPHQLFYDVLRESHNLKGSSRAVDLKWIETLSHKMETIFSGINNRQMIFDLQVDAFINTILEEIEDYVEKVKSGDVPPIPEGLIEKIEKSIIIQPPPGEDVKQARGEGKPDAGKHKITGLSANDKDSNLNKNRYVQDVSIGTSDDFIKVNTRSLHQLEKSITRFLTEGQNYRFLDSEIMAVLLSLNDLEKQWEQYSKNTVAYLKQIVPNEQYIRLNDFKHSFHQKIKLVSRKLYSYRQLHLKTGWKLSSLGRDLAKDVMLTRMVSAEAVYIGFRKMMRDMARDLDKKIEFTVSGMQIMGDRLVFQKLKDAIVHALRNAVCHGIESPAERRSKDKPETGKIDFKIAVKGNRLQFVIQDDGNGIDKDFIKQSAVNKGYISRKDADEMKEQDIFNLLFLPFFSTSQELTELAGRGMGLAIVQEVLYGLQGDCNIESEKGKGTKFIFRVPLTMLNMAVLQVKAGNQIYGIPAHSIERLYRVKNNTIELAGDKLILRIKNSSYSLMSLSYLLGIGDNTVEFRDDCTSVVLMKYLNKVFAVAVDEFLNQADVIVKNLPVFLESLKIYSGSFIRPDSALCLIVNPPVLYETLSSSRFQAKIVIEEKPEKEERPSKILIVDDSITTRTLEKTILEANGYKVTVGFDGIDALQILHLKEIDLVITDISMPRMDGYELVAQMKKDQRLKDIPVIIVSSHETKEDKEKGLNLGADAYIVKQKFEQKELLETIRQII